MTGFKTCTNGYCKSALGKFPSTNPDGTQVSYRKPWTKSTFQSLVLGPLQKTENDISAIATDGASVAQVFSDARRHYIELLNANTYSLDGMAAINQANNLALRDSAFDNELWRYDKAASWLEIIFEFIFAASDLIPRTDDEGERHDNLIKALIGTATGSDQDNLKKVLDDSNKNLVTSLVGTATGSGQANLKKVLEDFTSKLSRKFANVDKWAGNVGTWAGTVKGHTHTVNTVVTGLAVAGPFAATVTGSGSGSAGVNTVGTLNPLEKVPRTQPSNKRNLTGPLGDGSPITAGDTQVTLDWFNHILPSLNLTKEEEKVVEILGSEPAILIELLSKAREERESARPKADIQTGTKFNCFLLVFKSLYSERKSNFQVLRGMQRPRSTQTRAVR